MYKITIYHGKRKIETKYKNTLDDAMKWLNGYLYLDSQYQSPSPKYSIKYIKE